MPQTAEVDDTAPPAETDKGENNSDIGSLLESRHERTMAHEPRREVGERQPAEDEEAEAPAAAPPANTDAQPATTAETPPADAGEPDPASDPKAPKWYRDHMRKVNAELAELRAAKAPAAAPAAPAERPKIILPNPAEDPEGYALALERNFGSRMQQFELRTTLGLSERFAVQQHGREAFEDCKAWLGTQPESLENMFLRQPDPWGAAFAHYQREKLAEEIGDDPAAYRKRIEEEAIARYQAEQGQERRETPPASMRGSPPAPASTARAAAPRDPQTGRFAGPAPLKTRNSFD